MLLKLFQKDDFGMKGVVVEVSDTITIDALFEDVIKPFLYTIGFKGAYDYEICRIEDDE